MYGPDKGFMSRQVQSSFSNPRLCTIFRTINAAGLKIRIYIMPESQIVLGLEML